MGLCNPMDRAKKINLLNVLGGSKVEVKCDLWCIMSCILKGLPPLG